MGRRLTPTQKVFFLHATTVARYARESTNTAGKGTSSRLKEEFLQSKGQNLECEVGLRVAVKKLTESLTWDIYFLSFEHGKLDGK